VPSDVKRRPAASRRSYHSPLRADQAQRTRRRVLEAARDLFVDQGYAATTVASVADRAGVSPETIYLTLGGKRGLLEGVMDITWHRDPATDDEAWRRMVGALPDAARRLAELVDYSCRILARTRPIHAIIRGAADKEAFAAELGHRLLQQRLRDQTERIQRFLAADLAPELSVTEAGERYCALASPELYSLITIDLGWTADRHRDWLTALLRTELLGPERRGARRARVAPD
jgi:AcrR family transcriptional regulator